MFSASCPSLQLSSWHSKFWICHPFICSVGYGQISDFVGDKVAERFGLQACHQLTKLTIFLPPNNYVSLM
jgi:hypothetical protein